MCMFRKSNPWKSELLIKNQVKINQLCSFSHTIIQCLMLNLPLPNQLNNRTTGSNRWFPSRSDKPLVVALFLILLPRSLKSPFFLAKFNGLGFSDQRWSTTIWMLWIGMCLLKSKIVVYTSSHLIIYVSNIYIYIYIMYIYIYHVYIYISCIYISCIYIYHVYISCIYISCIYTYIYIYIMYMYIYIMYIYIYISCIYIYISCIYIYIIIYQNLCVNYITYIYTYTRTDRSSNTYVFTTHTHTVIQGVDFVCRGAKLAGEFAYLRGVSWMSKCLVHVTWWSLWLLGDATW